MIHGIILLASLTCSTTVINPDNSCQNCCENESGTVRVCKFEKKCTVEKKTVEVEIIEKPAPKGKHEKRPVRKD